MSNIETAAIEGRPGALQHPVAGRDHLAALDGLRFIAAACVMIAHGYWFLLLDQQDRYINPFNSPIVALSTIGMTLFFVLSGFVIHYNYAGSISRPGGRRNFFVARFARLYPLFFAVFAVEMVLSWSHPDGRIDLLSPLPLFLTFTQSWWFWSFGSRFSAEAYNGATGLMWSLSTEAFFYLVYPLLAPRLRRLAGGRLLAVGAVVALVVACLTAGAIDQISGLIAFAKVYIGNAQTAPNFPHWLTFDSPWIRIFEFLLGALAAQYVMSSERGAASAGRLCGAALALVVPAYLYCNVEMLPISGGITTCLSFAFAIVIATTAVSRHGLSRVLSCRWLVWGGEASYSLYLLHFWVLHDIGQRLAMPHSTGIRLVVYLLLMAVSVVLARVSYVVFERPATRLVRRSLLGKGVRYRTEVSRHEPQPQARADTILPVLD